MSPPSRWLAIIVSIVVVIVVGCEALPYNGHVEQHLAMEPQDQIAEIGARVTLPCRVVNKRGVLQWTRDDFGLGTRRQLAGFERYAMIGSDEEGDYSLQIYPVELEDDAQFQCQVSAAGHGEFHLHEARVNLVRYTINVRKISIFVVTLFHGYYYQTPVNVNLGTSELTPSIL